MSFKDYFPTIAALYAVHRPAIPLPFRQIVNPPFDLACEWTLAVVCGYLRTWSATTAYTGAHGVDPMTEVQASLSEIRGRSNSKRILRWPLFLRVGYA